MACINQCMVGCLGMIEVFSQHPLWAGATPTLTPPFFLTLFMVSFSSAQHLYSIILFYILCILLCTFNCHMVSLYLCNRYLKKNSYLLYGFTFHTLFNFLRLFISPVEKLLIFLFCKWYLIYCHHVSHNLPSV